MGKFAKLYEHDKIGQILVMKTTNDEGHPHVRVVTSVDGDELAGGPSVNGTRDEDWNKLDELFNKVDEEWAFTFAESLWKIAGVEL